MPICVAYFCPNTHTHTPHLTVSAWQKTETVLSLVVCGRACVSLHAHINLTVLQRSLGADDQKSALDCELALKSAARPGWLAGRCHGTGRWWHGVLAAPRARASLGMRVYCCLQLQHMIVWLKIREPDIFLFCFLVVPFFNQVTMTNVLAKSFFFLCRLPKICTFTEIYLFFSFIKHNCQNCHSVMTV